MKSSSLPDGSYATRRVHAEAIDLARWFGYKLIGIALALVGSFLVPGAVAGLGFGSICARSVESEGTALGEWFQTSAAVCKAISGFGMACALTLVAIVLTWALSRGWPRPLSSESTTDDPAHEQSAIVLALGLGLGAIPLLVVVGALPAITFVIRNLHLLSQQMDGIVLMVPTLQLTIAAGSVVGGIGLFLLFVAKDRLFPRTFLVSLPAQIGLLIASYQVLAATRLVTVPVAQEIPMAVDHAAATASVVRGLGWAFAAYAIMAPFVLLSRAVRARCADRSIDLLAHDRVVTSPPAPARSSMRTEVAGSEPARGFGQPMAAGEGPLTSSRFHVQATYVGGFFGARLPIRDLDSGRALVGQVVALRLRSLMQVFPHRQPQREIFRIAARRVLSLGGPYDVFDSAHNELLAVIRKRLAGDWEIHDAQDQLIGVVALGAWGMGHASHRVLIGPNEVGTLHWSNIIRPTLEIDYSMDVDQLLDRRVGLALGVLLFLNRSLPNA